MLEAYEKARTLLNENIAILHRLAQSLLERETLDGETIDLIIKGKETPETTLPSGSETVN
jgi:cell division protease FtsH